MNENRLRHSLAVARKMIELNNEGLDEKNLFLIGYLHDIGYEFCDDKINHNKIGGEILKKSNFKYWKEVFYHGIPNADYYSKYLYLLNKADMMIDNKGNDVGIEGRLENIKTRYGIESIEYINAKRLINELEVKNGQKDGSSD